MSSRLAAELAERTDGATLPIWVHFTDRGTGKTSLAAALDRAERELAPRTLRRRAKVAGPGDRLVDERDLPVSDAYVAFVAATGATPRERSRWFNAASFEATAAQITAIAQLPFVAGVDAVARGIRRPEPADDGAAAPGDALSGPEQNGAKTTYDYGPSFDQLQLANVPAAHDAGWTGAGVVIGVLDSGFRTTHEAFAGLDVIATYDFVNDDTNVDGEPGDPADSFDHGSKVLSNIAAFSPGHLLGPAFNASVILAKTEDVADEQPVEEDYWIAGLEWVESLGADIVSSSLGYYYWYTYEDLDGDTCLTTRAADMAAARGLLVITSAGNERGSEWGWVTAPADGDSVVAVGATYSNGVVAYFSSPGPTSDGRIKPDVMAMGRSNAMIDADNDTAYSSWSGTSFACPITAGVAALVLERFPALTPMQLRDALRETADRAAHPDNDYGWGMIDAVAALDYFTPHFTHEALPDTEDDVGPYVVSCRLGDPAGIAAGTARLSYRADGGAWQEVPLTAAGGDAWTATIPGQPLGTIVEYWFGAENVLGATGMLPAGAPAAAFAFTVDIDAAAPVIAHTPFPDWPAAYWAPPIRAVVTDNATLASVTVDWSIQGAVQTPFPLLAQAGDLWSAPFPTDGAVPVVGDTVTYTIIATDQAGTANTTVDGPHAMVVSDKRARVLVLDDTAGGAGPATMAQWLTDLNYTAVTVPAADLLTELVDQYQVLVVAAGSNPSPSFAANPSLRSRLRAWSEAGGRMFVEGGNLGIESFFWDPAFAEEVLRVRAWLPSNGGYFARRADQADHPVVTTPNALGASMVVQYTDYSQDSLLPAADVDVLYSPYSYPGAGGVLAYDDSPDPENGQLVFLTADITALWASANPGLFFENALAWLTTPDSTPTCALAGTVNLSLLPDAGATVTAGRFHTATTGPDGSFDLPDMYPGSYTIRVSYPGYEVVTEDLVLAPGEVRSDLAYLVRPVTEYAAVNDTVTAIPGSQPLGVDMTLTFGPEFAGLTVADLRTTVDITHNNSGELTLKLYSPAGTEVWLRHRSGGDDPDIVGTFPTTLSVDGPGSLDDFLGEPVAGTWRLNVSDTVLQVNGQVNFWSLTLAVAQDVSAVDDPGLPRVTALHRNVPNPFNPLTRIAFDLARTGRTSLRILDVRGRVVRTLVSGDLPAGRHEAVWNGRDAAGRAVASGVYFFRLETAGAAHQGKMLLVK